MDYTMSDIATDSVHCKWVLNLVNVTQLRLHTDWCYMGGIYGRYLEAGIRLRERIIIFYSPKYEHKWGCTQIFHISQGKGLWMLPLSDGIIKCSFDMWEALFCDLKNYDIVIRPNRPVLLDMLEYTWI